MYEVFFYLYVYLYDDCLTSQIIQALTYPSSRIHLNYWMTRFFFNCLFGKGVFAQHKRTRIKWYGNTVLEFLNPWGLETEYEYGCRTGLLEPQFLTFKKPRIDSKESVPPAYVAWRAGTVTLFLLVRRFYSTLLHLPPLRLHCVWGWWDRTQ